MARNIQIKFEDNTGRAKSEFNAKRTRILNAIGLKWQEIVVKIINQKGIVDTGALRNSMTFRLNGSDSITVGSPKEYATKQEFTNRKGKFLEPSLLQHKDTYKKIAENILKE